VSPLVLAGARAFPPEDSGGVWGYQRLIEALSDPADPEHDEYREWAGEDFDPERFDREAANERLRRLTSE
jgi:Plasmid pRiA4b ORF-3-like protein